MPTVNISCTTSTYKIFREEKYVKKPLSDTLTMQFPYKQSLNVHSSATAKATTSYQALKIEQARSILHTELVNERNKWRKKEGNNMTSLAINKSKAAVLIQAIYRGYISRKHAAEKKASRRRSIKKQHNIHSYQIVRRDIQDELRQLAADLNLKPIPGLCLDAAVKKSKNKENITAAAAIQLQCFIRLFLSKKLVKVRATLYHSQRQNESSVAIASFFRRVKAKREMELRQVLRRKFAAITIQSEIRRMLAASR